MAKTHPEPFLFLKYLVSSAVGRCISTKFEMSRDEHERQKRSKMYCSQGDNSKTRMELTATRREVSYNIRNVLISLRRMKCSCVRKRKWLGHSRYKGSDVAAIPDLINGRKNHASVSPRGFLLLTFSFSNFAPVGPGLSNLSHKFPHGRRRSEIAISFITLAIAALSTHTRDY